MRDERAAATHTAAAELELHVLVLGPMTPPAGQKNAMTMM